MWLGGAIEQSLDAFLAEPLDPFGHGLRRRIVLIGCLGAAQPTLHDASHYRLSTFRGHRRILVDVHLVPPWNTEASQPQLPRFRPDGQPPERPQLATVVRGIITRELSARRGAPGPPDFPSASALFVGAKNHACQGSHGHRIPASRVVTIARNAPLIEAGYGHDA